MNSPSETAHVREARRLCRQFTVELYLRRGVFWEAVRENRLLIQRRRWLNEVGVWNREGGRCAENECPGCIKCDPSPLSEDAPIAVPASLMDSDHPWLTPSQILITYDEGHTILTGVRGLYYRWKREFRHAPSMFRQAFFAGCLMYDPPPDKLLEYADHAKDWLQPRFPLSHALAIPLRRETPPGLPIEWIPFQPDFEIAVQLVEREYWETYIALYNEALSANLNSIGLDAERIIADSEEQAHIKHQHQAIESIADQAKQTDPSKRTHRQFLDHVVANANPYIRVDDLTSDDDARQAFSYLRSLSTDQSRPQKKKRDDLTAMQCAIWYDEFGWSHERIARHFDWKVQHPAGQKPRCETARQHIAQGRQLLKHKFSVP